MNAVQLYGVGAINSQLEPVRVPGFYASVSATAAGRTDIVTTAAGRLRLMAYRFTCDGTLAALGTLTATIGQNAGAQPFRQIFVLDVTPCELAASAPPWVSLGGAGRLFTPTGAITVLLSAALVTGSVRAEIQYQQVPG